MTTSLHIPSNAEITRILSTLYPKAHDIRHIEHGYENYIIIVDGHYVVRFPRSQAVWSRATLERFVLSKLDLPVVPKIVYYNEDPPYLVQTFLPGSHVSENEFRQLPMITQQSIGSQIAEFAYKLHTTLDVEEFKKEYAKLDPEESGGGSYKDYLQDTTKLYISNRSARQNSETILPSLESYKAIEACCRT